MTQPVVEGGYDYLRYFGLTVGTVAGVALVAVCCLAERQV